MADRRKECIRMLNGLEKAVERHLPAKDHRWIVSETQPEYGESNELMQAGWPEH